MAKRQVVSYNYTCDVCGANIPESGASAATRRISWEGSEYVLDVCSTHGAQLDEITASVKAFVAAGSRSTGRRGRRPAAAPAVAASPRRRRSAAAGGGPAKRSDLGAVRAWARETGRTVSERGRIPAALLEAYNAAMSGAPVSAEAPAGQGEAPAAATNKRAPRGRRARTSTAKAGTSPKRGDLSAVRAWARENGHPVSERGRIPGTLLAAYDAANNGDSSTAASESPASAPRKRGGRRKAAASS